MTRIASGVWLWFILVMARVRLLLRSGRRCGQWATVTRST